MRRALRARSLSLMSMILMLLTSLGAAPLARADTPWLSVRLASGGAANYPVSELQRVTFEGDTLIVAHGGGLARHATATIARIEFLWSPANSGVRDPRDAAALLQALRLFQNQPNPFSPETSIAFDLPQAGATELVIYGVDGRQIRRLVKANLAAGRHTADWDGRDDAGIRVSAGVYFYQLTAGSADESRRMVLLP